MQRRILFVGGVHGVGKSTWCNSMCVRTNSVHYSASELISRIGKVSHSTNKRVVDVGKNQDVLVTAVNEYLVGNHSYLLDGHFCLLSQGGGVTEVPVATFEALSPVAIIVLFDDPERIWSRLKDRDKENSDVGFLSLFQDAELNYSESVARKLDVPYLRANPFVDSEIVAGFAERFL